MSRLYNILNALKLKTEPYVQEQTVSLPDIGANSGTAATVAVSAVSGYTAIGLVGQETSSWNCVLTRAKVNNGGIMYSVRNYTGSAISGATATFKVLYVKD